MRAQPGECLVSARATACAEQRKMPRSANPDRDGGRSYRRHGWLFQADRIAIRGVGRKSAFSDANVCSGSILLKNCSRLEQRGFAEGHKPSPARVAFNSGRSMRSNFGSIDRSGCESSFSTLSVGYGLSRRARERLLRRDCGHCTNAGQQALTANCSRTANLPTAAIQWRYLSKAVAQTFEFSCGCRRRLEQEVERMSWTPRSSLAADPDTSIAK